MEGGENERTPHSTLNINLIYVDSCVQNNKILSILNPKLILTGIQIREREIERKSREIKALSGGNEWDMEDT